MKKNYSFRFLLLVAFCFIAFTSNAQKQINIDFGPGDRTTSGWNNVTNPKTGHIDNLNNVEGAATGYRLELTVPFTNDWNLVGTTGPDASLGLPSSATSDTFFGNSKGAHKNEITTYVHLTLQNLDVNTSYSFTFFASRMSVTDVRSAKYTVEGLTKGVVSLNASNNTDKTVRINNIVPKADGTIAIAIEPGEDNSNSQGFFYLGALQVMYNPGVVTGVSRDIAAGNIQVFPNPASDNVAISAGDGSKIEKVELWSVAGGKVLEQKVTDASNEVLKVSGLAHGLYIMHIYTNKGRFRSKLVIN